jgi:meso-butanediol dehydrogenase / (S,S)-butanediol dehydrogenase / diacetyl reductase
MQLEGKVALITGGGTGIGEAIARRFVAEGAKVCITGRRSELLNKVVDSLPAGTALAFPGDVGDAESASRMIQAALSITGRLDILVNNAAVSLAGTILDMEPAVWQKVIDINLTGPFLTMRAAIPHMIDAGGGSIINIASLAGVVCPPGSPGYSASKAGLIHLSKQVALDFGKDGVRCNVVCPGPVRTEMLDGAVGPMAEALHTTIEEAYSRLAKNTALKRPARPDEIPGVCVYLASDDSSFMTGSTLVIDGGTHFVDAFAAAVGDLGLNFA